MYDATQFIPGQVFNTTYLVEAYWRAGDIDAAQVTAQKGLDTSTRAGMKFYTGSMHRLMGEIVLAKNRSIGRAIGWGALRREHLGA